MYAISEFGSVTREDSDGFSDKDLLIVCEPKYRIKLVKKYEKNGYSVSCYCEKQLKCMKKSGSLFLQHLKYESKAFIDDEKKLKTFLESCELIKPDNNELIKCQKSIEKLSMWPNTNLFLGWKADYLFCLSRDFFIKTLARSGEIGFDISSFSRKLKPNFNIKDSEWQVFKKLREEKSKYRENVKYTSKCQQLIESWLLTLNRSFGFENKLHPNSEDCCQLFYDNEFNSNYERVRTLEVLHKISKVLSKSHKLDELICSITTNLNYHGSTSDNAQEQIESLLDHVRCILKKVKGGVRLS